MKRWMVRLGALSTVVLTALVLIAHAYKDKEKPAVAENTAETSESGVKPIPIAADAEEAPAASDPFSGRSRLMETAEAPAAQDRYARASYEEQPAEEQPTESQEPLRLVEADEAKEIPKPRNPFGKPAIVTEDPNVEPAATTEVEAAPADEATATEAEEAGPTEALTASEAATEETPEPAEVASAGDRYGRKPGAAVVDEEPQATPDRFGTPETAPSDVSAFAPPAGRTAARAAAIGGSGKPGDRKLEGSQSPSLAIEKSAPAEIQVGKPATFLIKVRNVGQVAANGVEIHDQVPQGAELVSTRPVANDESGKLIWQLGTLKPGDETTVEMQLTPTTEGEIGSVASVTFRADASVRSKATRPQLRLEASAPAKVLIGESAALKIRISNPGSGPATGVVLTEEVPSGFKHEGETELEFEVGTLAPGESRELELSLAAAQPGMATNVLRATGDANLQAEDQDEIEVIAPALKLSVEGPKRRYLQRNATYQFTVSNPGTAPAKNIELSSTLPRGLKFVEADNQGQYDATTHSVIWSLEELPPGEKGTVTLTTLAIEPGELKLQVASKAAMNLADSLEEEITVEGVAAIFFELVDVADPIEVGGETTYEIRVINQGSAAATNVRLVALLPPEMKALDADGPVQHTMEAGRVLFEPLGQLAPKADTMYTLKVQGEAAGDLRLRVQIVTDQITQPVTKEESTRVYSDE